MTDIKRLCAMVDSGEIPIDMGKAKLMAKCLLIFADAIGRIADGHRAAQSVAIKALEEGEALQ